MHPAAQRQHQRLDYQVLLAVLRPEPVTEHEVADLVQSFPDDSVSQACSVFVQYARQHDQEQQVRVWAEQLMADMRVETVCMNGSDCMLTDEQLVIYVNQDPDILPAKLCWLYYDTASAKGQLTLAVDTAAV